MLLLTRNKNPVHGRKLCSLFTANVQYTKMEKPALKTVFILYICCRGRLKKNEINSETLFDHKIS